MLKQTAFDWKVGIIWQNRKQVVFSKVPLHSEISFSSCFYSWRKTYFWVEGGFSRTATYKSLLLLLKLREQSNIFWEILVCQWGNVWCVEGVHWWFIWPLLTQTNRQPIKYELYVNLFVQLNILDTFIPL